MLKLLANGVRQRIFSGADTAMLAVNAIDIKRR